MFFAIVASLATEEMGLGPRLHIFWIWSVLLVHAPFFGTSWNLMATASFLLWLVIALLLSHFAESIPGQNSVRKVKSFVERLTPKVDPAARPFGAHKARLARCLPCFCAAILSASSEVENGYRELAAIFVLLGALFITCLRLEKTVKNALFVSGWFILGLWCFLWSVLNHTHRLGDSEILYLATEAVLANFATVYGFTE
jgi:hypothetical protein